MSSHSSEEDEKPQMIPFKKNTRLHFLLILITIGLVVIALNMGIPVNVLTLLFLSVSMTFISVFLMVWCFTILEEKRILDLSKKEYERDQLKKEQQPVNYDSVENKETVENNP